MKFDFEDELKKLYGDEENEERHSVSHQNTLLSTDQLMRLRQIRNKLLEL